MSLRPLQQGDGNIAGSIIGASFADDPVNQFLLGEQSTITLYNQLVAEKLYIPKGFGHISEDETGATLWLPPGISAKMALWRMLNIVWVLYRRRGLANLLQAAKAGDALHRQSPDGNYCYLYAIGNLPAARGRGQGGALLAAGLEYVDSLGVPAYLENSKESNIGFYRHFGFELLERFEPVPGCPPLWLMWRPPLARIFHQ